MASLYTHKDSNIRKTWLMFAVFLVVVIGIGWIFSQVYGDPGILYIAVIFSLVMNIAGYWFSDKIVIRMSRARPVEKSENPELYNIVENLSITAGLPMPKLYLMEEAAPNAFATGRNPKNAVIAVTSGLLARLDRSELEGVLAHELSHVGNRDILVSTVAVVLVGFIAILSDIFTRSLMWGGFGRRGNSDRSGGPFILLIAILSSILAPLAASLIQLAISRRREFLADASGALLTRYPEGLATALEKISKNSIPLAAAKNATAHLWFENPFKLDRTSGQIPWFVKIFMTHPPVEDRISALRGMEIGS